MLKLCPVIEAREGWVEAVYFRPFGTSFQVGEELENKAGK